MLDDQTAVLLGRGCALIIGVAAHDGSPCALRGWGVELLSAEPLTIRVLVDGDDHDAIGCLESSEIVAVTAADVVSLRSTQLKGRSRGVGAAPDAARTVMRAYVDQFFGDIVATDGTPREVLERILPDPAALVSVTIDVEDQFDQTPGPSAGRAVEIR